MIAAAFDAFDILRENTEPFLFGMLIFLLVICFLIIIFSLVAYVLTALGVHTIAKRRGILNPWLAWIPFGYVWILGSLSDQYQYIVRGKIRRRSSLLLILEIIYAAAYVAIKVITTYLPFTVSGTDETAIVSYVLFTIMAALILVILALVLSVFTYIALYDLYSSCNPDRAVTFLLLSIFLSVTQPFFIFACRKKDLGMSPENHPHGDCVASNNLL